MAEAAMKGLGLIQKEKPVLGLLLKFTIVL
jgi:hypothetical protein